MVVTVDVPAHVHVPAPVLAQAVVVLDVPRKISMGQSYIQKTYMLPARKYIIKALRYNFA